MVDALGPIVKEGVADALGERDDVKEGVATMKALVEGKFLCSALFASIANFLSYWWHRDEEASG